MKKRLVKKSSASTTDSSSSDKGVLYVVATPIGNLEDITLRAVRVLREVDCIAAEDTRQTRKLLSHLGIHAKLISYFKHREMEKGQELLNRLGRGECIALVADAGTPCISDPGTLLVRAAREQGYAVVPVPGVSALTTALSVSGIDTAFSFHGFLPAKEQQRKKILQGLSQRNEALVFYESPRRVVGLLRTINEVMEGCQVLLARELTKLHEEILHGGPKELLQEIESRATCKGEFVVIVTPQEKGNTSSFVADQKIRNCLDELQRSGRLSMRDAVLRFSSSRLSENSLSGSI
ncbi:MAG: 16S rRNA (cytidine(1402)-2'-O)-methyltransferase [Deltaproteobacteria bacterium]